MKEGPGGNTVIAGASSGDGLLPGLSAVGLTPPPFDLAVRASNLAEQTAILDELGIAAVEPDESAFSPAELHRMTRLTDRLGVQVVAHDPARARRVRGVVTVYRLWERDASWNRAAEDVVARIHASWLGTYQAAMEGFEPAVATLSNAPWREHEVFYGRLACACQPFLAYAEGRLASVLQAANTTAGRALFDPAIVADATLHLLERFRLPLTWAVEADKNVYCLRNGIPAKESPPDAYIGYLNETFADLDSYHRFYLHFPVLGRWLALVTGFLCEGTASVLHRLARDCADIGTAFFSLPIDRVLSIGVGKSDSHANGLTVGRVEVELVGGDRAAFIYKPRNIESEVATQRLLSLLERDNVLNFAPYQVLTRDGYGYAELIPSGRNHVSSRAEAAAIYEELGGYLAIFHAFGGGDFHFENILVADGHLMVCDCETILGVRPLAQDEAVGTVMDSVYKTGMLEWPHLSEGGDLLQMRLSGLAGGEPYQIPMEIPQFNDENMSFKVGVHHAGGVAVDPGGSNRVYIGDQIASPTDFKDAIIRGFEKVHAWFGGLTPSAVDSVVSLFDNIEVRFINFATQLYAQLLMGASHPKCLMDPLQVDLVFNRLEEHSQRWDRGHQLAATEIAALWQLDVPLYTVWARETQLLSSHQHPVQFPLAASPSQEVRRRFKRLTPENSKRQVRYISASLAVEEVHSPEFITTSLEYAKRIGEKLCDMVGEDLDFMHLRDLEVRGHQVREVDILANLYDGTAGIAFFLGYLDSIVADDRYRAIAERALEHAMRTSSPEHIGAFQGTSGLIYVLTHLASLWHHDHLLDQAIALSRDVAGRIDDDRHYDILSGAAGVIPVMLALARQAGGEGLACAHRCARHLLDHADRTESGLSWPPYRASDSVANLTGFAHGPSGIGWALVQLGADTDRSEYIAAGLDGFRYERSHFDEEQMDWYELRTSVLALTRGARHFANAWCNGAAGIGLSRIASWAILDSTDDELLKEAYIALAATLRNFHALGNDSLCHGRSGNSELYLRFAKLKGEPAFQMEANLQAQTQWNELEVMGRTLETDAVGRVFPGLMLGLAGTGLHFLRLAYPDHVPSPLLLDPPTEAQ